MHHCLYLFLVCFYSVIIQSVGNLDDFKNNKKKIIIPNTNRDVLIQCERRGLSSVLKYRVTYILTSNVSNVKYCKMKWM